MALLARVWGLAATYFYVYCLMQVPTGVLFGTLGLRRIATVGSFVAEEGALIFASATKLALAVVGRALVGLGVSVFVICMPKVAADTFGSWRFVTATTGLRFAPHALVVWRSMDEPAPARAGCSARTWPHALLRVLRIPELWPALGAMLTAGAA